MLDLVANRWAVLVLTPLDGGSSAAASRWGVLRVSLEKTLTRTLREFQRNGLVDRRDHGEILPASAIPSLARWGPAPLADRDPQLGHPPPSRRPGRARQLHPDSLPQRGRVSHVL